jgi:hypothetical protein
MHSTDEWAFLKPGRERPAGRMPYTVVVPLYAFVAGS